MKNLFLAVAIACSATLFAQTESIEKKEAVPSVVSSTFAKEYHNQKAKWGMEGVDYEAEFKLNGNEASAVYDKKGHRKALEIAIKASDLPTKVMLYVKTNYPATKITETAKITDDKNVVSYEVEIKKNGKSHDLLFDATGKFIKIVDGD